jgi:putative endonuclease
VHAVTRRATLRVLRAICIARAPRLFARVCTPDDRELGEWGEEIAARYLEARGWRILARRMRTPCAEVDLVAFEERTLVCIEVKTARMEPIPLPRGFGGDALDLVRWRPGARCDARRIARLRRTALLLARTHGASRNRGASQERSANQERGANRRSDASRHCSASPERRSGGARVDLIEVFWLATAERVRVVHHPDVRAPLE